ncbi:MAG: hypothetical protein BWK79_10725 [Beggiatoa sp. IS2]|nr:MAG: hypothetical protein BWK79_10725 [Beggiatoa sp. IS2]
MYTAHTVSFHDNTLISVEIDGVVYVAMKPIVEGMGLAWGAQHRKLISQKERFSCTAINMIATDGKSRKMLCIPENKLDTWYYSVNMERTKPCAETAYRDNLANQLINCGWQVEIEKQTSIGRIDIYATAKERVLVIECKMSSKGAANALGQLLFYKQDFPKAQLVFACQQRLSNEKLCIFKRYKILVISCLENLPGFENLAGLE